MTNKEFCKIVTEVEGEEVDDIRQIKLRSFNGEELKEWLETAIKVIHCCMGETEQLKTFDIHNCINEICKHANHVDNRWVDVSENRSFRYNVKKAIDKMLCKK